MGTSWGEKPQCCQLGESEIDVTRGLFASQRTLQVLVPERKSLAQGCHRDLRKKTENSTGKSRQNRLTQIDKVLSNPYFGGNNLRVRQEASGFSEQTGKSRSLATRVPPERGNAKNED
jgi:hypothetical protein